MKTITSRQNPVVARVRAIVKGGSDGEMLLDGAHLVNEALDAGIRLRLAAVAADAVDRPELRVLLDRLRQARVEVVSAGSPVMRALSPGRSPSVVVAIADRLSHDGERLYSGGPPLVIIATDVQEPGNVGAMIRAAEAGGATGVVAAGGCADPLGWKALRGSMGSALRLPVVFHERPDDAVSRARQHGCRIVAASPRGGRSLFDVDLAVPAAVLIGAEGAGLPSALVETADEQVSIPMRAPVESLNAAVTTALFVYEARRQRRT